MLRWQVGLVGIGRGIGSGRLDKYSFICNYIFMTAVTEPSFLVIDKAIFFARIISQTPRQIIADLYQSRDDFDHDKAFERGAVLEP
jgi:hypothetical protein